MQPEALDELVERLVIEPVARFESWLAEQKDVPEYSRSHMGMCYIAEMMKRKGFEVEVTADGAIGFGRGGYAPWTRSVLKATAIAAVLAVQGE